MMSHRTPPVQISRLHTLSMLWKMLLVFGVLGIWGCRGPLQKVEFEHAAMGTRFRIVAYHHDPQKVQRAANLAQEKIDQIEQACSDWNPQSEIRQLCSAAPSASPVRASRDLVEVLSLAVEISRISEGAFDPTIGPLVRLWRRCQRAGRLPRPDELQRARRAMGIESIVIDNEAGTVQLLREGIAIDLGGIAKGYATDAALEVMEAEGIEHALIDGGGDISLGIPPPHQNGWRIALEPNGVDGDSNRNGGIRVVLEARGAVATSGDASRFVEIDGKRYSHILDPATGIGVPGPHAVTVHAARGALADALATAISVLGVEQARALLNSFPGSSAVLFDPAGGPPQMLGEFPGITNH